MSFNKILPFQFQSMPCNHHPKDKSLGNEVLGNNLCCLDDHSYEGI